MSVPEVQIPTAPTAARASPPRRKRKRTPAAGAANDCFTCSSQNVSCDRKRPYCTPCLGRGENCAGYRTTLTWGVGVASRGKLRGLSLPIAGNKQKPLSRTRGPTHEREPVKSEPSRRTSQKSRPTIGSAQPFSSSTRYSPNDNPDTAPLCMTWQSIPSSVYISSPPGNLSGGHTATYSPSELPLEGSMHTGRIDSAPSTAFKRLAEAYGKKGLRPLSDPIAPSETTSQLIGFDWSQKARSYSLNATNAIQRQSAGFWSAQGCHDKSSCPSESDDSNPKKVPYHAQTDLQEPLDSVQAATAWLKNEKQRRSRAQAEAGQDSGHLASKLDRGNISRTADSLDPTVVMLSSFSGTHAIGKTPRMQYLINYYAEVISPVIVAFDGPTNPYRSYILRLASGSETLQHAISALSASNLRQRRESGELSTGKTDPARRSSMAHLTLTDKAWQSSPGFLSVEDQRKEENYHKNATVHLIQRQFADPSQHKDDSVLATLLIVCLFHICESGVAKFRTHFAGAKKLLGMRESANILKSKEAKWFTRMFTWFDSMTATVNDREGQMQDRLLDISSLLDEDWTLENLAGCDGKLFKIMANLSRLNILSQKGVFDDALVTASCSVPTLVQDPSYWSSFDGNSLTTSGISETLPTTTEAYPNIHTPYGREWHNTRHALISWTLDTSPFGSGSRNAPALSQDQQLDLLNISESFRFSALIYIERLALPFIPSSDPRIQIWVQKALYYIRLVCSDVYLLWPLFVTGSECVTDDDRHIVRERCLDIQKDSGFSNNASCLKLLEKIWTSKLDAFGNVNQPSGFRWRSVMGSNASGGEYIVV